MTKKNSPIRMKYKSKLIREFWENGKAVDCPVYDMHGHMGPWYGFYLPFAKTEDMVERMSLAGIKMLLFCHHAALTNSPDIGNKQNIEAVRKFPDKLRAYCGINPNYPEIIEKDLCSYDDYDDVYVGFKFLADYHKVAITDKRYKQVWEFANKKELLVLLHTWGGSICDGENLVREVAEKYHKVKIIAGHSCHGKWDIVTKLAKKFPNVYLDLCAVVDQRKGLVEKFVKEAGSEKILFGTDFPWYNHHYYIGGVLAAEISEEDMRNIFYRNAQKLLKPFLNYSK